MTQMRVTPECHSLRIEGLELTSDYLLNRDVLRTKVGDLLEFTEIPERSNITRAKRSGHGTERSSIVEEASVLRHTAATAAGSFPPGAVVGHQVTHAPSPSTTFTPVGWSVVRRGYRQGAGLGAAFKALTRVLPLGRGEVTERAGNLYVR
jgi:hypothetical protein